MAVSGENYLFQSKVVQKHMNGHLHNCGTQNIFQKMESLECALDSSNYCLDKAIAERCCISNKEPKW